MNNTSDNFIQQTTQLNTSEGQNIEKEDYKFTPPKINYPEELITDSELDDSIIESAEMTQAQWKKYYKKMGLE